MAYIVKTSRFFHLVECWGATSSLRAIAHQYKTEKYVHICVKTSITSLEVLNFLPILSRYGYDSSKILSRFVPLHCDNLKYKKIEYITLYFENKYVRSFHIFLIVVLFPCRRCLIIHWNTV